MPPQIIEFEDPDANDCDYSRRVCFHDKEDLTNGFSSDLCLLKPKLNQ